MQTLAELDRLRRRRSAVRGGLQIGCTGSLTGFPFFVVRTMISPFRTRSRSSVATFEILNAV